MKKDVYDLLERGRDVPLLEFIVLTGGQHTRVTGGLAYFYDPVSKQEFGYNTDSQTIKLNGLEDEIYTIYDYSKYIQGTPLDKLFDYLHKEYPLPQESSPMDVQPYNSPFIDSVNRKPVEELKTLEHYALKYIDYDLMKNFIEPAIVFVNQEDDYLAYVYKSDTEVDYVHVAQIPWDLSAEGWCSPTGKHATTTIDRGSNILNVFSQMDEYLAFEMLQPKSARCRQDALIIPDSKLFEGARPFMEKHGLVQLHLPNNDVAKQALAYAEWLDPVLYKNMSHLYKNANSVRDKLHQREEKAMQRCRKKPHQDLGF